MFAKKFVDASNQSHQVSVISLKDFEHSTKQVSRIRYARRAVVIEQCQRMIYCAKNMIQVTAYIDSH